MLQMLSAPTFHALLEEMDETERADARGLRQDGILKHKAALEALEEDEKQEAELQQAIAINERSAIPELVVFTMLGVACLVACIVVCTIPEYEDTLSNHFDTHDSNLKRYVDEHWKLWMFDYLVIHLMFISFFGVYTVGTVWKYHVRLVWLTWREKKRHTTLTEWGHYPVDTTNHLKLSTVMCNYFDPLLFFDADSASHMRALVRTCFTSMKLRMAERYIAGKREKHSETETNSPMTIAHLEEFGHTSSNYLQNRESRLQLTNTASTLMDSSSHEFSPKIPSHRDTTNLSAFVQKTASEGSLRMNKKITDEDEIELSVLDRD